MASSIKRIHGEEFKELAGSVPRADIAAYFGVSVSTLKRWISGESVPLSALRLARLRWRGNLSDLYGREWFELSATPAGLQLPGWRRPFSPGDLRSMAARLQQLELLKIENSRLRKERAAAWQAQERAEDAAAYYRHQLSLESRLGAIVQRLGA